MKRSLLALSIFPVALGLILSCALSSAQTSDATPSRPITVGENVQVSAVNATLPHYEVILAADPAEAKRLLACSIFNPKQPEAKYYYETVCYLSVNGGHSWAPTLTTHDTDSGDPAVAFGPNGDAYFAELHEGIDPDGHQHGHTYVYVSHDSGKTWSAPQSLRQSDREYISVDDTGGPRNGRVYINAAMSTRSIDDDPYSPVNFTNGFGVWVSSDRGASFHVESLLNPVSNRYVFADGNSVVMADGTYAVIFPDVIDRSGGASSGKPNFSIKVITSSDGGEIFSKAVTIANIIVPSSTEMTTTFIPSIAVDRSDGPFHDRLYAVWINQADGRMQIFLAHSTDHGKTWSSPVTVNDDIARPNGKGPDDHQPIVAVNKNGVVGVTWYDRRDNPDNLGSYERFSASLDGGETFLPSVRVAEAPASFYRTLTIELTGQSSGGGDLEEFSRGKPLTGTIGYSSRFAFIGGDTEGLAADADGTFHALWTDNRTGLSQVWTAPIFVQGHAQVNGSVELATMTDVTNKITIDFADARFDRNSGTVTVEAYLLNTSDRPIDGPIKARFMTLTSQMGIVTLVDSDNALHTRGAVIDFTPLLQNGKLMPNQTTAPRLLTFHLNSLLPEADATADSLTNFVNFTTKVYAR